ncbi:unnamed protein product, partial [marine sediment metagenome]
MEIRVTKLREALDLVQSVVPRKTTLPVLTNVLIKEGKLAASNLDLAVAVELPSGDGECLIPFRQTMDLLKRIPGNQMLTIEQNNKVLS